MIQSVLVTQYIRLEQTHIYGSFCCDNNSLPPDCSLTIPTLDTNDLRNLGSHFHLNEKNEPMNSHRRHTPTMPNHYSLDLDSVPPLRQHCWERHLVSIGAKLYFYSCLLHAELHLIQDLPEQTNWSWRLPQLKIFLVLFFHWIYVSLKGFMFA